MASISNLNRDNGCFKFKANRPHFFKVILQQTIDDGKLGIPKKFVKNYGDDLSNPVFLKVPTGAKWKVELVKSGSELLFQNGWTEFAKHYSLCHGSFLVFEYERNCLFHVIIFDMSALEIDYPSSLINADEETNLDEEEMEETCDDDVSVQIIDDTFPCQKSKEKLPLQCPRPQKQMRANSSTAFRSMSGQKQRLNEATRRTQPLTADEKANALGRASSAFKSRNPFFMVVMQPSHVFPACKLNIPYNFAKLYFKKSRGHVMLRVSDGRQWRVMYSLKVYSGKREAKFHCCWKAFVLDNNLEVGDVCVFKLIKGSGISLDVVIFRATEAACCGSSLIHQRGDKQAEPIKSLIDSVESDCNDMDEAQELQVSESTFDVMPGKCGKSVPQQNSDLRITQGLELENQIFSTCPFFKIYIRPCHFGHSNASVPFGFVKRYIKDKEQTMALQVAERSWPVKLAVYSSFKSAKLSSGWAVFVRENFLEVGDACAFEMVNTDVLKVTIFRRAS